MSIALIFPGQGSQQIGMAKDFYDNFALAREVMEEVEEALSQKLGKTMFEGPESDLNLTENTQPALMTASMMMLRCLEAEGGITPSHNTVKALAGHSLGEYTALAAAGSLTVAQTAKLLKTRGQAMQKAVPVGKGAMAAILGLEIQDIQDILKDFQDPESLCAMANDNCPGQVVISGHKEAVEKAMQIAQEKGARKAVPLPVSAPFHCSLMLPAAEVMNEALSQEELKAPIRPIVTNISACYQEDPEILKQSLVTQVTASVRWRESMSYLRDEEGIETFVEIGSGAVLSGLMKRIDRQATAVSINSVEAMSAFLKQAA